MTKEQEIIKHLIIELEFVANNPEARAAKTASEYAADLLFALKIQTNPEAVKKWVAA